MNKENFPKFDVQYYTCCRGCRDSQECEDEEILSCNERAALFDEGYEEGGRLAENNTQIFTRYEVLGKLEDILKSSQESGEGCEQTDYNKGYLDCINSLLNHINNLKRAYNLL